MTSQATSANATRVDGRRAARERNLAAVVDAMLELFAEGNFEPGAQEVAERSGVSRRSVFRYFDDMEGLGRAAIERMRDRLSQFIQLPGPAGMTLGERIAMLAQQRATLFEMGAPAARVARLRAPFRPLMREELARNRELLGAQVEHYFAVELNGMEPAIRTEILAAADALSSFEMFDFLTARGSSAEEIAAIIERSLAALFASVCPRSSDEPDPSPPAG